MFPTQFPVELILHLLTLEALLKILRPPKNIILPFPKIFKYQNWGAPKSIIVTLLKISSVLKKTSNTLTTVRLEREWICGDHKYASSVKPLISIRMVMLALYLIFLTPSYCIGRLINSLVGKDFFWQSFKNVTLQNKFLCFVCKPFPFSHVLQTFGDKSFVAENRNVLTLWQLCWDLPGPLDWLCEKILKVCTKKTTLKNY